MGMYNCAATLPCAIDSLFAQTHPDWELVACDDRSTDDSWAVARRYADRYPERIHLIRNETNRGPAYSRNRCLERAAGEFIAVQDADDSSRPDRFARQVRFLQENPTFGWVSSAVSLFDDGGEFGVRLPKPIPTRGDLIWKCRFAHPTTMFRAEVLKAVQGYRQTFYTRQGEDYDLWMRLFAAGHRGCNLLEPLYRYREDRAAYGRKTFRGSSDEVLTRLHGYRAMRAPIWAYPIAFRPLAVALVPARVRRALHQLQAARARSSEG
jgi:glycosyltransferase EpsE